MTKPKSKTSQISIKQFVAKLKAEETRMEMEVREMEDAITHVQNLDIQDSVVMDIIQSATDTLENKRDDLNTVGEALSTLISYYTDEKAS